jgi:plastocyanin
MKCSLPGSKALRRINVVLCAVVAVILCTSAHASATIEGRVELPKTKTAPVVAKRYDIVTKGGVVSTNPPLAVVYLEGKFERPAVQPIARVIQKDLVFIPSILPVQVGTRVEFPNEDDVYHNIFSYSSPKRFDLGRYRADERPIPSQVFDVPGLVTLRCDIHDHMRGLVLVLETPHFVVTDPEGRFSLTGLPPGKYLLKAWISSQTTLQREVELADGATLMVELH